MEKKLRRTSLPTVVSSTFCPNLNSIVTDLTVASVVSEYLSKSRIVKKKKTCSKNLISPPPPPHTFGWLELEWPGAVCLIVTVGEVKRASFLRGADIPRAFRYSSNWSHFSSFQLPRNLSIVMKDFQRLQTLWRIHKQPDSGWTWTISQKNCYLTEWICVILNMYISAHIYS